MKKAILVALALFASAAQAEGNYATIKGEYRNGRDNTQDANAYSITVGQNINQYLDGELYARLKQNDDDTNNTRVEGALVGKYPLLTGITLYTRSAIGDKFDGSNDATYWSLEPGIKAQLTADLAVKASLRFRDAFSDSNNDSTRTYRLGTEYALSKVSVITAGYDRSLGDSEYDAVSLGYGIKY